MLRTTMTKMTTKTATMTMTTTTTMTGDATNGFDGSTVMSVPSTSMTTYAAGRRAAVGGVVRGR